MPMFSVVMPVYNRVELVATSLESVLAQTCRDFEVIVVDDGSDDATPAVLERYADRVAVVRQANLGPGAARNRGIEQARGAYVAFLDSDDLWFPWTLATHAHAVELHNQPSFLAGGFIMMQDATSARSDTGQPAPFSATAWADYYASSRSSRCWYGGTCGVAVKTDVLRRYDGFLSDRLNAEDLDLWLRLGTEPGFVQIHDPPLFRYRQHGGNAVRDVQRSVAGVGRLLDREAAGVYPGGRARRSDRLRILTMAVRQASLAALRVGERRQAWELYLRSLAWHLRLYRWRYVAGFLIRAWQLRSFGVRVPQRPPSH